MRIFDLSLKLSGYPFDEAKQQFAMLENLDRNQILAHQQTRKNELLKFHQNHNNFYRSLLHKHGIDDPLRVEWRAIPVLKKADMQMPLESRLSDGFTVKDVFKNNTSGSSGTPFYFARDKFCHAITWACYMNRFGWHGIDFNKSWQARFYGIPLSKTKYLKEKIKDLMAHRVRFPVFNLEDKICAQYLMKFGETKFEYLNGYTSSLVLFAKYCIKAGVVLRDICPTLKVCITTSEMCDSIDRAILYQGFGIKVVNEYGAAELDLLAFEDADGHWCLNEETLFIEVLDEQNNPVPDGEVGRIVVTSLYNKAHPMIRYELGDFGAIQPNALQGYHRILQKLEGRTNDVALLPSGKKVPGLTFYYVTKGLLEKGSSLKEFVIRQLMPSQFEIRYVADGVFTKEEENEVIAMMDKYLEPGLDLKFTKCDIIERTRAGKLRQFENLVK